MYQNYSGQNLRGRSFKGQNLEGADFSRTDIRGANFTNAILVGANFSDASAGLQKRWTVFLFITLFSLSASCGYLLSFMVSLYIILPTALTSSEQFNYSGGLILLAVIIILFILILTFIFIFIIRKVSNSAVAFVFAGILSTFILPSAFFLGFSVLFYGAIFGALVIAGAFSIAGALATVGGIGAIVNGGGFIVGGALIVVSYIYASMNGTLNTPPLNITALNIPILIVVNLTVIATLILLSTYIAFQSFKGDKKYVLVRKTAIAFAAISGTSFYKANLTDANFTGATFKSTDFASSNLTRTRFHKTKKLDRVRPGLTYLKQAKLIKVLVTGQGQNQNFDYQDLRGVNFQGTYLQDTSFIGADLSNANLQDADLSRAKLVQTQLDGTDFTGATLTGAYLEDWNITSTTNFTGVRCQYVYMRQPTKDNPDPYRKPDNREEVFGDGEFGDFIQPIFDTLDLYHSQGVDPRAIAVAFKELAENNPNAELEIVAIERRGDDKILLRAKAAATASKSELSREYFINYNEIKALAEQDIKMLIAEKERHVYRLENMVLTALERPNFYAETVQYQGDIVSQKSETSNYDLRESKFGGGFVGTGGNQTGGTFHENSSSLNLQTQPKTLIDNQIICTQCNCANPKTFNFCIKCGAKLTSLT